MSVYPDSVALVAHHGERLSVTTNSETDCSRMANRAKLYNMEHGHILRNDWIGTNRLIAVLDDNEDMICCGISSRRTGLTTDIANSPGGVAQTLL